MTLTGKWFGFGQNEAFDRGMRCYFNANLEEAIEELNTCLLTTHDPITKRQARFYLTEALATLGKSAIKSESFEKAAKILGRAIEIQPNYPDLRLAMAMAYRGLGQREEQEKSLAKALELNPKYASAMLQQGIMMYEDGQFEAGLARVAEAVENEPSIDTDKYRFALECHSTGDTQRALANLLTLSSIDSSDANQHARLAEGFAKQKRWIEAAEEYERALSIAPTFADLHCRLGEILLELDQVQAAIERLTKATEINPRYADALASLGIAYRRLGDQPRAHAAFSAALAADANHLIASREISRLPH